MDFQNNKKTFLAKLDKSKKGDIDELLLPLIQQINSQNNYFTTSSCSGRVVIWNGSGKKNETTWLKVSHSLIDYSFFDDLKNEHGLVWLRVEPFILHVCCRDLDSANKFLSQAKSLFKKSSLLSISNKIIVEVKGSELIELPLLKEGQFLFNDLPLLVELANQKLSSIHQGINLFLKKIKN